MIGVRRLLAGLMLVMGVAAPAHAVRVVDYAIDDATATKYAQEQQLMPLVEFPAKSDLDFVVEIASGVDHEVIRGGIACSAWTVQNPLSLLARKAFIAWDKDGALTPPAGGSPALLVHIDSAATFSRCVLVGELEGVCISRVSINGSTTASTANAAPIPFHVEVERKAQAVGACAGLTRGIGLISRQAVIELMKTVASRSS